MTEARTFCYWNLHRGQWSQRLRGKVVRRSPEAALWMVDFRVSEPGRQRVLRDRVKNVHAYAAAMAAFPIDETHSTWAPEIIEAFDKPRAGRSAGWSNPEEHSFWREVRYNPYRCGFFFEKEYGREVLHATRVILTADRKVLAYNIMFGNRETEV